MLSAIVRRTGFVLPFFVVGPLLSAQAKPLATDVMFFETKIGSFKLLNCTGKLTFSFQGTVLVSGLEGTMTPGGNIKKEFESKDGKRVAFFGTGTLTLSGKWRGVQWFGTDMKGQFDGNGVARLTGEFDENMNTGHYWYKSNPEKQTWFSTTIDRTIPPPEFLRKSNPVRGSGG